MDQSELGQPAGATTGQFLYGLLFLAAIGLAGLLVVAFVLAQDACGCTTPATVVVVNHSSGDAVIEWQSAGLMGTPLFRTSGRETARACESSGLAVAAGEVSATVSVGARRQSVALAIADRQKPSAWVVVDAEGRISVRTNEAPTDWPDLGAGLCP
jgi:hypothetical protein